MDVEWLKQYFLWNLVLGGPIVLLCIGIFAYIRYEKWKFNKKIEEEENETK